MNVSAFASVAWTAWPDGPVPVDPAPECGDMLGDGLAWLTEALNAHVATPVVYQRAGTYVPVCATIGATEFEVDDGQGGVKIQRTDRDFLIPAARLVIGQTPIVPRKGDQIRETRGNVVYVFEVMRLGPEPEWRWSDPYRTMRRIHTKQVGVEVF